MDYLFCARDVTAGTFVNEPGPTQFLAVPTSANWPKPEHHLNGAVWKAMVLDLAQNGDPSGAASGDVVVLVHGYNISSAEMLMRHRLLRRGLEANGFEGVVVSFDWASDDRAVSYVQDRGKAMRAADQFARNVLPMMAGRKGPGHRVKTHLIGHSLGCLVLREAFGQTEDQGDLPPDWSVDQLVFVAADVSAQSLAKGSAASAKLFRHSKRMSNYYSQHDGVLTMSDAARGSAAPRAGRIGMRGMQPNSAVDVFCGGYFDARRNAFDSNPVTSHNWYFEDAVFMRDLFHVIDGKIVRDRIPTRSVASIGGLELAV